MKKILSRVAKLGETNGRSKISKLHLLIAAVAIIECLILISFTTYSWIETASSLVIETGKKNYEETISTRIPIANALNYKFVVKNEESVSDLNDYFSYAGQSSTQNLFRYARASSANGKDFFFKNSGINGSNSTVTGQANYRKGDYVDINSNYTHFDFTVANTSDKKNNKLKFYFADANVFSVTNAEGSELTQTQLNTIRDAMRISFQTGSGTPKIYSRAAATYGAVSAVGGGTTSVTTTAIESNVNQKLFTVGKNNSQNISVRIWLEEKASGISGLSGTELAGANITVNLKLAYAENDYDFLYFDDYTFSSGISNNNKENIGGHLTEDYPLDESGTESNNYRMFFVYRTSNSATGYVYPMTLDDSGSNTDANCWVTCDSSGSASSTVPDISGQIFIANLTNDTTATGYNSTTATNARTYSYFAYGKCAKSQVNTSVNLSTATTTLYKWELGSGIASPDFELRYSGYSVTNTAAGSANAYGAGFWKHTKSGSTNTDNNLSKIYFRDLATAVTDSSFNAGTNFKYITEGVNTASDDPEDTTHNRKNVMYVNIQNNNTYSATTAKVTATMYYDKGADGGKGLFVSWVPTTWLNSANLNFRYSPSGLFNAYTSIKWVAGSASKSTSATDYIYTALGYSEDYTIATYNVNTAGTVATGTGCWNNIESEPVYFSTELIDNVASGDFRYQIGVNINNGSTKYYSLIPDDTNTKFYAYIPVPGTVGTPTSDYANGAITFCSFSAYNRDRAAANINGYWFGRVRNGSRTYYPIELSNSAATSDAPKGYWNLAVIVDGTYEHFFWDYGDPTTSTDDKVLGTFSYNTTGHVGSSVSYDPITPNMIDEYRWYVPFDITTIGTMPDSVYFKWNPYAGKDDTYDTSDDTVFKYSHYRSNGIYCVITEASDNTPANAFS